MEDKILNFLKELKYSFKNAEKVFTEGSCLKLCLMFKSLFPATKILYSEKDLHYISEIDGKLYDIHGIISPEYADFKEYREATEQEIENDRVATFGGLLNKRGKYIKTI